MIDSPEETPTVNEPISRTTMTFVMLHPSGLAPAEMNYHDLAAHLTGDFVAARTSANTEEIADDQVDVEIDALGGAPGYFKRQPLGIELRRER